LTYSWQQMNCY